MKIRPCELDTGTTCWNLLNKGSGGCHAPGERRAERLGDCNGSIISVTLLLILPYIHSFPYLIVATLFVRIYTQLGYLLSGLWLWASAHIHQKIIHPPNNTIGFGRFSSEGLSDSSTNLPYTFLNPDNSIFNRETVVYNFYISIYTYI
jgi:hypothetical protein